ncbi:DUF805 domain-containing protein [Halobacillus litoralis]|uniref:DUF805 domain-containing protein n=1 Tax=Halobacillus litoralis TaxID=45668 RepID=UPI001CD328E0|nr:DUF805 domain-containing protein [Halobacillus litoralis]MCA0970451.1 DUF805 domain-containing protein [Halobacillus litoralis]
MKWYVKALRKYAVFRGRARRKEFWWFHLINLLMIIGILILNILIFGENETSTPTILGYVLVFYFIGTILPSIAVTIRRLHDSGRSGWWFLLTLIPFIGGGALLVFALLESDTENRFGSNPKQAA